MYPYLLLKDFVYLFKAKVFFYFMNCFSFIFFFQFTFKMTYKICNQRFKTFSYEWSPKQFFTINAVTEKFFYLIIIEKNSFNSDFYLLSKNLMLKKSKNSCITIFFYHTLYNFFQIKFIFF